MPAVWLSKARSVTFLPWSRGLSGSVQLVSLRRTSPSSESVPCSTSRRAATAVKVLLMEPAWKSVRGVIR